jgi:hypothetical protein
VKHFSIRAHGTLMGVNSIFILLKFCFLALVMLRFLLYGELWNVDYEEKTKETGEKSAAVSLCLL